MPKTQAHPQVVMHQLVHALSTHLRLQQYTGQMSASEQKLLWTAVHQQWVDPYCRQYKLLSTFCGTGAHLGGAQTQILCLIINALAV